MPARLALIQKELQRLQVLGLEDTRSLDSDDFGEYYRHLLSERESNRGVEKKLEFRWNALNKLSPSLVGGDLVILVAESGAGKTSWMGDQAEFWWKSGAHGVFYHLELPLQKMSDRRMARNSGISSRRLQDGRGGVSDEVIEGVLLEDFSFLSDEEVELIEQTILEMNSWPGSLVLKHCPGWTMSQICADARQRALSGDLDFMVIDYFNKLRVVSRHRGSYVTFDRGQDIELFKATIEELECVGVMAAQFGGAAKNMSGIRMVAHARETAELDDKCNIGLSLDRPLDQELGKRVSFCTLYVTKCNAGQEGKVELYFDGSRYRFLPGSDAVRF
jgi:replicative DNA helicase